jgi:hypothetical protein
MEELKKVLQFVERRMKNNELRRVFNYDSFLEPIDYEARMRELQEIKDFIEDLIKQKEEEGR